MNPHKNIFNLKLFFLFRYYRKLSVSDPTIYIEGIHLETNYNCEGLGFTIKNSFLTLKNRLRRKLLLTKYRPIIEELHRTFEKKNAIIRKTTRKKWKQVAKSTMGRNVHPSTVTM